MSEAEELLVELTRLALAVERLRPELDKVSVEASYWCREVVAALGELVALAGERIRDDHRVPPFEGQQ